MAGETNLAVERNEIKKPLCSFKIIRGANKDKQYPAPQVTAETLQDDIKWLGAETVIGVLQTFLKRTAQEIWLDNIDEATGEVNQAKFLAELADLTAVSMKLSELEDKRDELIAKQGMLVEQMSDNPTPEVIAELKALSSSINVVKAQMDAKSRKTKPESKGEPAVMV